jgi:hypothetical protein
MAALEDHELRAFLMYGLQAEQGDGRDVDGRQRRR